MANPKQVNATEIEITREVPGAWVTFGPGAAVMKVVIQQELLAVKIRRLPPKSTPEFVSELLSRFDIHIPANRIQTALDDAHRYTHEMSSFAVVHTDNPELPKMIHDKLHADDRPDVKDIDLSKLIVFAWNPQGPREPGGFSHHISSRTVIVNWPRPMRNVQLRFRTRSPAIDCAKRFNEGNYKVLGEKVSMGSPHFGIPLVPPMTLQRMPDMYIVRLLVPVEASAQDVLKSMPHDKLPDDLEMEDTKIDLTGDPSARRWLESSLKRFGTLETELTSKLLKKTGRYEGAVRFKNEADARQAIAWLCWFMPPYDDSGKSFTSADKFDLVNLYTATYRLSRTALGAVWEDFQSMQRSFSSDKNGVQFDVHCPCSNGEEEEFLVLNLSSKSQELMAETKKRIDALLEGHTLGMGDDDPIIREKVLGLQHQDIKNLECSTGVAIRRFPISKEIRLYGTNSKVDRCRSALRTLADGPQSQRRESLVLDKGSQANGDRPACGLCQNNAEALLITSCQHSFCADCFEDFCRSIKARDSISILRCPGQAGSCSATFSLPELQRLLSSFAFQDVLTSSFSSYISSRPNDLRHCPTTGCTQLYRVSLENSPPRFDCSDCHQSFCRRCHSDHPGVSCILNRHWLGLGPPPHICWACLGEVEVVDADYLLCPGCGVRICNFCFKFFPTEQACGDHLLKTHSVGWDFWKTDESLLVYSGLEWNSI